MLDAEEERVLGELEDLAQKAQVVFDFGDSKVLRLLPLLPLPPTPERSTPTSLGTPSYFSILAANQSSREAANPFSPVPINNSNSRLKRRTSSGSSSTGERPFLPPLGGEKEKAEVLAAEAMVLYFKALAFLGKGIEKARRFWSARNGLGDAVEPSVDFNQGSFVRGLSILG